MNRNEQLNYINLLKINDFTKHYNEQFPPLLEFGLVINILRLVYIFVFCLSMCSETADLCSFIITTITRISDTFMN